MDNVIARLRAKNPLIHCITNPISIHQCANAVLAVGARPIMAEHPGEVREITRTADSLMLNLGNITDARMASIRISGAAAREGGIPFLLDAVGTACSTLRRDYCQRLLEEVTPTVIKGNYSEILSLHSSSYKSAGVDADSGLTAEAVETAAVALARHYRTVVLASGKTDIITDGFRLVRSFNGTPQLSTITGTGCMLGALCASFLAVQPGMDAAVTACAALGICGELAQTPKGSGSFQAALMDALSTVTDETLTNKRKMEELTVEAF